MWTYTKCTSKDREEKLNKLTEAFAREKDCSRYLSEVQKFINSTQTTIVLAFRMWRTMSDRDGLCTGE